MKDNLLIVGGSGFIGKSLAKKALNIGFKITIISLNRVNKDQRIAGVSYLQVDITNFKELREKLSKISFSCVVNLSGYVNHSSYLDGGNEVINAHFNGLQNLLQALDWGNLSRFIQIGSSDEYGHNTAPQSESMKESPISPYSLGKLASTRLLQMLHETEDFPAVVLRLFLVYGEGQCKNRFLPQIINGCLLGKSFPVSKGRQLRDFCHIDDITSGILKSLNKDEALGEVINLGSGSPISIIKVVKEVQKIIGSGYPEYGKIAYRKNEIMELYPDIDKAKHLLGWHPKMNFIDGLKRTIDFYRLNN